MPVYIVSYDVKCCAKQLVYCITGQETAEESKNRRIFYRATYLTSAGLC